MGGLDAFEVQLGGAGIYFSGQTLQGQIILDISEEQTNIKTVTVKLKGKGEVHWSEQVTIQTIPYIGLSTMAEKL